MNQKANEVIVTREHREAACRFRYPWLTELPDWALSWIGGNEESAGLSLELTRIAKALAEAEHRGRVSAEPRWIPCSERMPSNARSVLFTTDEGLIYLGWFASARWNAHEFEQHERVMAWFEPPRFPEAPQPTKET